MPLKSLGEPAFKDLEGISFAMTDGTNRVVFCVPYGDLADMARVPTVHASNGLETFYSCREDIEDMVSAIFDARH